MKLATINKISSAIFFIMVGSFMAFLLIIYVPNLIDIYIGLAFWATVVIAIIRYRIHKNNKKIT